MWPIERVRELWEWLLALPPDFAFLLSMPFLAALTAALGAIASPRRSRVEIGRSEERVE